MTIFGIQVKQNYYHFQTKYLSQIAQQQKNKFINRQHNLECSSFSKIKGPVLPYRLQYSFMAETPDGRGVLLFGGQTNKNFYEDRILELCAGDSSWNILNITLENGRREHVVIPLQ